MTIYLGENIRKLRQKREITQETLADFLGVTFQSVSRWERGESYPDITLLPEIAGFFKISVDELLGVNRTEDEKELKMLLKEFDNLRDKKLMTEALDKMRSRFPTDFRVQLRYMGYLTFYDWENLEKNSEKIVSVYENIQNNCTDDSIRICAKRTYIDLLEQLSCKKNPTVSFNEFESLIRELPRIRDTREMYCFSYRMHEHPDADKIIQDVMEEMISVFYDLFSSYYFRHDKFSREYQIETVEKTTEFFNYIYNDGNYSKMWRIVMNCCYGLLGWSYHQIGNDEKALYNLRKSAELAVRFDNLERVSTLHSTLFEGKAFDKQTLGSNFIAKSWMKENICKHYPLSEEFKATPEFKEIAEMLKQ